VTTALTVMSGAHAQQQQHDHEHRTHPIRVAQLSAEHEINRSALRSFTLFNTSCISSHIIRGYTVGIHSLNRSNTSKSTR
jgi:hypothetical protein